jgi:serine/threonine protein kinase
MSLTAGTMLGPYEILAPIGAGGMGEVYRARDTKLKRDVALKVLPEAFAKDPGRMLRFQREAEVLASLNHPNIAHIYGVEERALVMELVEGESPKGSLPFEDAWRISLQIANALEYAHEKGVIHRDLKPANVKVTPDGVVKLLDFGLAKAFSETPQVGSADPENSPTITLGATVAGTVLGTAAYMSPEQAKGKKVDKRADIWSWGVVLYELLTGERLFKGGDKADTLAQVLTKEPPLERVPPQARKLLRRCLEKDPKLRLRDIGEARHLLENETAPAPPRSRREWLAAAALAPSVALGYFAWKHFREEPPRVVEFSFPPPEKGIFPPDLPTMSVSPDGQHIVFEVRLGRREVWVRDLDNPTPRMLAVIEAGIPELPIWSPDSRRLAFFDGSKLKKIDLNGGPALTIADTESSAPGSGSWNRDGVFVFGRLNSPLFLLQAGGTPQLLTELDETRGEIGHWAPWFLPDSRHFLYLALTAEPGKSAVYAGDLASKTRKRVLAFGARTIYVNPGYLLFTRERTLMAQPFDTGNLETTGDASQLANRVDAAARYSALGHFSASQNGVLAYTSGGAVGDGQLTWYDRSGKPQGTVGPPGYMTQISLSPDGSTVAFARQNENPQSGLFDIWTRDIARGLDTRLTSMGDNFFPVWSADGAYIYFVGLRDGSRKVYRKAVNGLGTEELVDAAWRQPMDASDRYLFTTSGEAGPQDIWVRPLSGGGPPYAYLHTGVSARWQRLSPDSHWLAYESDESNGSQIQVVSFPSLTEKWTISTDGGQAPVWSRNGRELYYHSPSDNKIMTVAWNLGGRPPFGVSRALFPVRFATNNQRFEVNKDGRFLVNALVEQEAAAGMTVVLNWPELLKKK